MGRNLESNRRGYHTRSKLYKSTVDNENERIIKRDYTNPIVFYAKDHVAFELIRNEFGAVMQRQLITGFIETMDLKEGQVKVHDTVEYGNKRYNVESVRYDTNNAQNEVRNRVVCKSIIKLGATVDG